MLNSKKDIIQFNKDIHDSYASYYDEHHTEIFNAVEQKRLKKRVRSAVRNIETDNRTFCDLGCGTGNLTKLLIDYGDKIIGADISENMLYRLKKKYPGKKVEPHLLSGSLPLKFKSNSFGFVGCYSVLHHIPDYLGFVEEMVRIADNGAVIFIDHEYNRNYYFPNLISKLFNFVFRNTYRLERGIHWLVRSFLELKVGPIPFLRPVEDFDQGDLHVTPDDYIEWEKIKTILKESCCIVEQRKYVSYNLDFKKWMIFSFLLNSLFGRIEIACNMECVVAVKRSRRTGTRV